MKKKIIIIIQSHKRHLSPLAATPIEENNVYVADSLLFSTSVNS